MKLVILYGPPAAGKLTIAQNLARIADIRVFDNHQVIDMIESLVTRGYSGFVELVHQTQQSIVEAAVQADQTDVVTTYSYASNVEPDVTFITELTAASRKLGAEAYPIFVKCSNDTLLRRAVEPSRKAYGKITTTEVMSMMIERYAFDEPAPVEGNLTINTDEVSAADAALEIKMLMEL